MAKKEKEQECPKCGCKSFVSTSLGMMCKECKTIIDTAVPLPSKQDKG